MMPRGDGTGPVWGGGAGSKGSAGRKGQGRMGGNRPGSGPGGEGVCPQCGAQVPHERGVPCSSVKCPQCGTALVKA